MAGTVRSLYIAQGLIMQLSREGCRFGPYFVQQGLPDDARIVGASYCPDGRICLQVESATFDTDDVLDIVIVNDFVPERGT